MIITIARILWILLLTLMGLSVVVVLGYIISFWRSSQGWKRLLLQYQTYSGAPASDGSLPEFSYQEASAPELMALRQRYGLDAIAAGKSEMERIVALMKWVHGLSKHAGSPEYEPPFHAMGLIQNYVEKKKGMNCMMHAIILCEVYLAEGFKSRLVRLLPYDTTTQSCHWVVIVYAPEAGKWIMMDADIGGYLRDPDGNYLDLAEIRERLATGGKFVVNRDCGGPAKYLGGWAYPCYLAKNVFRFNCYQVSEYGQVENCEGRLTWSLVPAGYNPPGLKPIDNDGEGGTVVKLLSDPAAFWRVP